MPDLSSQEPSLIEAEQALIATIYRVAIHTQHWPQLLEQLYQLAEQPLPQSVTNNLLRHFQQALEIGNRFQHLEETLTTYDELFDRIPIGVLIVSGSGQIHHHNHLARQALKESTVIQQNGDLLQVIDPAAHKKLLGYIQELSIPGSQESRGLALPHKNNRQSRALAIVSPLLQHLNPQLDAQGLVLVFVSTDDSQLAIELAAFADIYQLTPKEKRITQHIVQGLSPQQIANKLHVSYNTVRSQLKSVFQKTSTNKQSELVNLVLSGPGGMLYRAGPVKPMSDFNSVHRQFRLTDGRVISYQEYGDPKGEPVIYCHSILGSRLENFIDEIDWANRTKLRLIIPERPGYGFSSPHPTSYIQWAEDLREFLDGNGLDSVALIGFAAGGIYAAAAAVGLGQRIRHLVLVSTYVQPEANQELKLIAPLYRMHIRLAQTNPKLHQMFSLIMRRGFSKDPIGFFTMLTHDFRQEDSQTIQSSWFQSRYLVGVREATRQGVEACSKELTRIVENWQFEMSDIHCPVTIWHGEQDQQTPVSQVKQLCQQLPQSDLQLLPGHGQLVIYDHWPMILAELSQGLRK